VVSIGILNVGVGNIASIENAVTRAGGHPILIGDLLSENFDAIILPGAGSFEYVTSIYEEQGVQSFLKAYSESGKPILGICLGAQILYESSQEGPGKGVSVFTGHSQSLADLQGFEKVPHIGYSSLDFKFANDPILSGLNDDSYFYFLHNFGVEKRDDFSVVATIANTNCVAISRKLATYAVQFHPEKSGQFGDQLFSNFIKITEGLSCRTKG
jgi:imidazole glycerol-phosphate synthase subunit HisH